MNPELPPVQIVSSCPKNWSEMTGDSTRRFCGHCQLHVHNLSAMRDGERNDFLRDAGGRTCIAYEVKPNGSMVTPSKWSRLSFYRAGLSAAAALAAVFPMLFSSCASNRRMMGAPLPPPEQDQGSSQTNNVKDAHQKGDMVVGILPATDLSSPRPAPNGGNPATSGN